MVCSLFQKENYTLLTQSLARVSIAYIVRKNQVALSNWEGCMEHPRIDLAHEPDFAIGYLYVHPSTRELLRGDERHVIEPRVMQVLVALYRAGGAVVSKDDLVLSCWEGRIVGDDAINRVISRLRRVSEGIGNGALQVETVTRVGYRLRFKHEPDFSAANASLPDTFKREPINRRAIMAGAVVALTGAASSWFLYRRFPPVPAELAQLIDKAASALDYGTPEQNDAAVAVMREAARRFPDRAEAWGKLAVAYRQQGLIRRRADAAGILNRINAAARRAVEIDPGNEDGAVIITLGNGLWYTSYIDYDRRTQYALTRFPDHAIARRARAGFLFETGRIRESIKTGAPMVDASLPSPAVTSHAIKLWCAGRPDEADALLDTLIERWPRHFSIWASRFKFLMFSGKLNEAETMLDEAPVGLDDIDFEIWAAQTIALQKTDAADIDAALSLFDGVASKIMSKAQEAASFSSVVNRLDAAFAYLDLFYVSGEPIRSFRERLSANSLLPHSGVMTFFLFEPPMQTARTDPRFDALTFRLGLQNYWKQTGVNPDYLT